MSEWWTYSPSDFLLFSARVYYRLFELHNQALWPAQILMLVLGLAILWLMLRPMRNGNRFVFAALGALWIWIAWSFFLERYGTINWASVYIAPLFALQGLAMIWFGAVRGRLAFAETPRSPELISSALFTFALVVYPLLAPLFGRSWTGAEIFGIAPDPTAAATLAVLANVRQTQIWLMVVPMLWCALTGEILHLLDASDFFVAPTLAFAAVAVVVSRRVSSRA